MPRTPKKKGKGMAAVPPAHSASPRVYAAGIYARLSVDGEKACGQGNSRKNESIETQIEIAKAYASQQEDMVVVDCYTDIGKTGTNFEREGFERLMRDVRMRRIDCVIVKDLSRFGRNHVETGNYIEKIFPFLGVRFIAVTDHFDSLHAPAQDGALSVSLKNLVNEMYAKDIAIKAKASRREKWEQGSYTGSVPPYGYRVERVGDIKCLYIEETTSDIVKKIFELFLSGKNMREIAVWLYGERIVRPTEYHKTGHIYCPEGCELLQWPKATVKMILTNPVYMGCLVQGRTCGKDYMMRDRHDIDSEDWSVKEHTHEAIVSEDIFFQAASRFEKSSVYCNKDGFSKAVPVQEDIFAGVLCCGDCGAKMKRVAQVKTFSTKDKVRTYSYNCPNAARIDANRCATRSISLTALTELVREAVRQEFALSAMRLKDLTAACEREAQGTKKEWSVQSAAIDRKIEELTKNGSEQYLKYRMGELSESAFRKACEDNAQTKKSLQKQRTDMAEKLRTVDVQAAEKSHFLRMLAKGKAKAELSAEAVETLIQRIEVYPDHRIKVIFAFRRSDFHEGGRRG